MLRHTAKLNLSRLRKTAVHVVPQQQYATLAATEVQNVSVYPEHKHKYATSASIEVQPYKLFKLDDSPNTVVDLTRDDGLEIFKKMVALREMTNSIKSLYKTGTIRGFCHLSSGQEACCVGMNAAITDKDAVITAYRTHGWAYLKHIGFHGILSELTGRATGTSRGKGGSSHMYNPKFNFFGGNSIVGMQVPLGAGIAFGFKYQQRENICITIYGDGTANQGQVFEAFNIAKLWDIPCLFVCENNGYAISTTPERSSANTRFYTRGDYIPGIWVDGMDVLAVREATRFAKAYVLKHGPIVIELDTYRFDGHSLRDPALTSELKMDTGTMQDERDPITLFKETILNNTLAEDSELESSFRPRLYNQLGRYNRVNIEGSSPILTQFKIESEIKGELDEVAKLALTDPALPLDAMYKDIYVDQSEMDVRGVDFSLGRRHSSCPTS